MPRCSTGSRRTWRSAQAGPVLIGELRELTAADRLAERPAGLLMRALAATGRQAEALAVYRRTRELLADSLGVDPSPQLDQAYLAVLRQEIPQAAPPWQAPTVTSSSRSRPRQRRLSRWRRSCRRPSR